MKYILLLFIAGCTCPATDLETSIYKSLQVVRAASNQGAVTVNVRGPNDVKGQYLIFYKGELPIEITPTPTLILTVTPTPTL